MSIKPTKRKREITAGVKVPRTPRAKAAPKEPVPTPEPDRKILVAVDFGTTYSGLAWAQTRKPEIQTPITQWPDASSGGLEGVSSDKVPTEIIYEDQKYRWGFQIPESILRQKLFKLDLDPDQLLTTALASRYHDPLKAPPTYDGGAVKIVEDYLTALRKHAEQVLRYKLPQSALTTTPIEYIITVPAVWSAAAQAKTRLCAEAAGMGAGAALHMISEPEAAAMYALEALDPHGIKIKDTFLLVDAGGGTVDLITYTVSGLKPILKLTEASPGSGNLCGATYLNRRFEEFLDNKLRDEVGWDEEVSEEAMKRFEAVVKRQFRGTDEEEFIIPVPGVRDNKELGIRKNKLAVSGAEVKAVFEPVIKEVLKLVMGQIKASHHPVKAIILVGGFGQSAYLCEAIREEVKTSNIEVMQSPNSWTAVVRGALMKGLASASPAFAKVGISGRSARKHYGISAACEYFDDEHDHTRRVWDAYAGFYRIYSMDWFINKGKTVKEDHPVKLRYHRQKLVSRGPFASIKVGIFFHSDPHNTGAPKYLDDPGVTKLVEVEADLSRIPVALIPKAKGTDGKMYYKIDYQIAITYYSAYTTYELIHNKINYGLVSSEYV